MIELHVTEPSPVSLRYVEAAIKPETVGHVTPTYEQQTVYPTSGTVFGSVEVDAIPEPTDVKEINDNGDHDVRRYGVARVNIHPRLQSKNVTPTEQLQPVTPDSGFDGLDRVEVNPIPSEYIVPSGSLDITENGNGIDVTEKESVNVNVPVPPGYIKPTGKVTITENQTNVDISEYAKADIAVEANPTGWVFDLPTGTGNKVRPTRARFFPTDGYTDTGYRFLYSEYVGAQLTTIEVGEGTTSIGYQLFQNAPVERFVIPSTVTSIGDYFCRGCANLEYIEYKCDCDIGYYLFGGSKLKQCICRGNVRIICNAQFPSTMELYDFSNCTAVPKLTAADTIGYGDGTVIRIPSALYDEWISATNWCDIPTDTSESAYVIFEGV